MSRKSRTRVSHIVRAVAPIASAVAASVLVGVADAPGTTWIGTTGNWTDPANWSGTPNPPSDVLTSTGGPNVFIGNNGVVTFDGPDAAISRMNLGFSYIGMPLSSAGTSTNPGTAVLNVSAAAVLRTNQDQVIGDGAVGTLNINGGTLYIAPSKHVYLGATANGTINLSAGNLFLGNKYGVEDGGASSSFNMSGGNLEFKQFSGALIDDNQNQVLADHFTFSGGTLGGAATTGGGFTVTTIHHVSGSGSISLRKNGNTTLTFDLADAASTWNGTSAPAGNGSSTNKFGTLVKTGTGQLTITNTQDGIRNFVRVSGGTLVFDYAANALSGGIIHNETGIDLRGGTLVLKGVAGGATTELIGIQNAFSSTEGGSTVILDPNGGSITLNTTGSGSKNGTRAVGSTIDFQAVNGGTLGTNANVTITTTTNRVNNLLKGWTLNGGTEFGVRGGAGNIVVLTAYEADTDLGAATAGAAKNMRPTGPQSDVAASVQFNSINLTGSTGINMTGAATTISLTAGALIANTTGSITGGALTVAAPAPPPGTLTPIDLVVTTPSDLTIASNIVDNGDANSPVALTKSGTGTLTMSGTNTYGNNTYVTGGMLKVGGAAALPGTTVVVMSNTAGAILDLNGNNVSVAGVSGGGSSGGEVRLTGGATLTLTPSAANTFAGVISGTGGITKATGSELVLSGKNTYTGVTTMTGGTLTVTSLADGGQPSSIGAASSSAANLVLDGATLRSNMKTTMTTNRLFSVGPGGATLAGNPTTGSSTGYLAPLRFTDNGMLGMTGTPSARALVLDAGSTAQSTNELALNLSENKLSAVIPDSAPGSPTSVTKQGVGLWYLDGLNTYTGATTINGGILRINSVAPGGQPSSIGAATDNLALNGATLQYIGAGHSTNRLMTFGGSAANVIDASGAGALSFTNIGATALGSGNLQLTGTNTDGNTFSPALSGSSGVAKNGPGTWVLNGTLSYTGATSVSAGKLVLATEQTTNQSVSVTGGTLELAAGGGSNRMLRAPALTISSSGGGKINLQDNKLITANSVGTFGTSNTYSGVTGLIASGRNGGGWNGASGIMTTQTHATTSSLTSIGVATAGEVKGIATTDTATWAGQTVTGSDTLVMYTYGGDANLDGQINIDDYGHIDTSVGIGLTGWFNGDFNYDGQINIDDYGIIDVNVGVQSLGTFPTAAGAASLSAVTAVPEPATVSAFGLGIIALAVRRRRVRRVRRVGRAE